MMGHQVGNLVQLKVTENGISIHGIVVEAKVTENDINIHG